MPTRAMMVAASASADHASFPKGSSSRATIRSRKVYPLETRFGARESFNLFLKDESRRDQGLKFSMRMMDASDPDDEAAQNPGGHLMGEEHERLVSPLEQRRQSDPVRDLYDSILQ